RVASRRRPGGGPRGPPRASLGRHRVRRRQHAHGQRHPLAQEARRARRLGRSAHRARRRLPARGGRARAMSPRAYVLDRLPLLLAFAAAVALLLLVVHLTVGPLSLGEAAYFVLLALVATTAILAVDYLRQRTFRQAVATRLDAGSELDLSPLPRGASREQRAMTQLLNETQGRLLAELQRHKAAADEHRAFVDLWVHQMKTPLAVLELTTQQRLAQDGEAEAWASVAEEV